MPLRQRIHPHPRFFRLGLVKKMKGGRVVLTAKGHGRHHGHSGPQSIAVKEAHYQQQLGGTRHNTTQPFTSSAYRQGPSPIQINNTGSTVKNTKTGRTSRVFISY